MEDLGINSFFWRDRRVLVTGHTGFKGGWLSLWLRLMGAKVHGFALSPPTEPNLFTEARVEKELAGHVLADIRDFGTLKSAVEQAQPEVVFHLAAQPLVRYSYRNPVETYEVNVMGVVHLLEAIRATGCVKALVNVTTDKCYENHELPRGYREGEALGGHDPYSSSKACAELVTAAFRSSFLAGQGIGVATARAGNVIGGGDWGADRLVPDFLRALDADLALTVRSPESVRPWQHVLEPVSGYLLLAERLHAQGAAYAEPWNFGPADDDARTVGWVVDRLAAANPGFRWNRDNSPKPHETSYLRLDSSKARTRLHWRARWSLETALDKTLQWHRAWRKNENMRDVTIRQIEEYLHPAAEARLAAI